MYTFKIPQNEREYHARGLGLSLRRFDSLVQSANYAHDVLRDLGPFYGKGEVKDPTFRITAEPVSLPKGSKETFTLFGNDLFYLAKALQKLPKKYALQLGDNIDFRIPPTWRVDVILDENGCLKVNEIEGVDSANALMMAEQVAYKLQRLKDTTVAKIIPTYKAMAETTKDKYRIAYIRTLVPYNPHTPNHIQLVNFINVLSEGTIHAELLDESIIRAGITMPRWEDYDGIINHTSLTANELYAMGVKEEQLFAAGNYNAMVNKGVFALFFDVSLTDFWIHYLGKVRYERMKSILIPTTFVQSLDDIQLARKYGKVVKVSWAGKDTSLINRSKGVAIPVDSLEQGEDARWDLLQKLFLQGTKLIIQDFVMPSRVSAFLRKRGTTLEKIHWYNRICVKYVTLDHPNRAEMVPDIALTATEVTLGPNIIPAGRECSFTAGKLR